MREEDGRATPAAEPLHSALWPSHKGPRRFLLGKRRLISQIPSSGLPCPLLQIKKSEFSRISELPQEFQISGNPPDVSGRVSRLPSQRFSTGRMSTSG